MKEPERSPSDRLRAFAQSVGHDFNDYLTGVLGAISLAGQDIDSASRARPRIEQAILSAQRATLLARQLLSISERKIALASLGTADLNETLLRARKLLELSLPPEAVLSYELAPNLPPIRAQSTDVQGICVSLVMNAGEALEEGAGVVTARTGLAERPRRPSTSEAAEENPAFARRFVWVEVKDTGQGISSAEVPQVEKPFFTTKPGHRGLGLTYVRAAAEAFGGEVKITSDRRGTAVRVLLPQAGERPKTRAGEDGAVVQGEKVSGRSP